jgi:hypothetical protein
MMYYHQMRTTFAIDDDLLPRIKILVQRKKQPLRKVLNDLIRASIGAELGAPPPPFEVRSRNLGLHTGFDPDRLNSLVDEIESDEFVSRERR